MTGRFPRQFGKYVLLKPLAKGGMGEIYLAVGGDVGGFEKLCVIKKVITEKADRTKSNRFLDEAKVVLRLAHSALVNTFDAGEVGGRVLHRHGAGRGQGPARGLEPLRPDPAAHPAGRGPARGARGRPGAGLRAQLRRPQAGPPGRGSAQHAALVRGRREADRLRPGPQRAQAGAHRPRRRVRPRRLPGARAGPRARWPTPAPTSTRWASCCGSCSPGSSTCSCPGWIRRRRWRSCAIPGWSPPRRGRPGSRRRSTRSPARAGARPGAALPLGRGDAAGAHHRHRRDRAHRRFVAGGRVHAEHLRRDHRRGARRAGALPQGGHPRVPRRPRAGPPPGPRPPRDRGGGAAPSARPRPAARPPAESCRRRA